MTFSFILGSFYYFFGSSRHREISTLSQLLVRTMGSRCSQVSFTLLWIILYLLVRFVLFPFMSQFLFYVDVSRRFRRIGISIFRRGVCHFFCLLQFHAGFFRVFLGVLMWPRVPVRPFLAFYDRFRYFYRSSSFSAVFGGSICH